MVLREHRDERHPRVTPRAHGTCSGHGAAAVPSGTGKESSTTAVDAFFLGLGMPTPRGSLPLAMRAALDLCVWETAHELHVGER